MLVVKFFNYRIFTVNNDAVIDRQLIGPLYKFLTLQMYYINPLLRHSSKEPHDLLGDII